MATIHHDGSRVDTGGEGVTLAVPGDDGRGMVSRLTGEQVWREVARASFAVLRYITPSGGP